MAFQGARATVVKQGKYFYGTITAASGHHLKYANVSK
jgi:hypothetical protein